MCIEKKVVQAVKLVCVFLVLKVKSSFEIGLGLQFYQLQVHNFVYLFWLSIATFLEDVFIWENKINVGCTNYKPERGKDRFIISCCSKTKRKRGKVICLSLETQARQHVRYNATNLLNKFPQ